MLIYCKLRLGVPEFQIILQHSVGLIGRITIKLGTELGKIGRSPNYTYFIILYNHYMCT